LQQITYSKCKTAAIYKDAQKQLDSSMCLATQQFKVRHATHTIN